MALKSSRFALETDTETQRLLIEGSGPTPTGVNLENWNFNHDKYVYASVGICLVKILVGLLRLIVIVMDSKGNQAGLSREIIYLGWNKAAYQKSAF